MSNALRSLLDRAKAVLAAEAARPPERPAPLVRSLVLTDELRAVAVGLTTYTQHGQAYQVVDATAQDGSAALGLLLLDGSLLVVPSDASISYASDIASLADTPTGAIPDFTFEDALSLRDPETGHVPYHNRVRLWLFGPVDDEDRALRLDATREAAHEAAIKDNRVIHAHPGELPAAMFGIREVVLMPAGVQVNLTRASDELPDTRICRPHSVRLWAEVLEQEFEIDPDFTMGHLFDLLDVPEDTDRFLAAKVLPPRYGTSLRPYVRAMRQPVSPEDVEAMRDIEFVEVTPIADHLGERYQFSFRASGRGYPITEPAPGSHFHPGDRDHYALAYSRLSSLRRLPLRYEPTLEIPVTEDEHRAYMNGPVAAWAQAGRAGPRPEWPYRDRLPCAVKLGEFLRAIFAEISFPKDEPVAT